jgi:hypothetical protein
MLARGHCPPLMCSAIADAWSGRTRAVGSDRQPVNAILNRLLGHYLGMVTVESSANTALVTEVARDVLSEIAPQEIPILAAASRAYFANPAAALRQASSKDNVLGFGIEAAAVVVTPAVLFVMSEVLDSLTRVAKKAIEEGLTEEIPQVIKAMFRKFHSSAPAVPSVLTKEQLALIHGNVQLAAKKLRLSTDQARSLANAVTAQLVLAKE